LDYYQESCKKRLTATIWKVSIVHISRVGNLHVIPIKNTASMYLWQYICTVLQKN